MDEKIAHLPDKSKNTVSQFSQALIEAFGTNLYSLILFGSAARSSKDEIKDNFKEGASDINTAIVLETVGAHELNIISNIGRKFKKSGLAIPLVFKRGHIASSLDTFPLEFSDMKQTHIVLFGADPLAEAKIENKNLRYQCEAQLKGQLVQLRRGFLASGESVEALTHLISASVTSILAACRGMALLAGKTPPEAKRDLLKLIGEHYNVDVAPVSEAWQLRRGDITHSTATMEMLMDKYLTTIEELAEVVDKM